MDRRDFSGFTLIEILIVIVIISIVGGAALLTISNNKNKQLQTAAHQLAATLLVAEEEAMLRPATLGLAFTPSTFQFYQYIKQQQENLLKIKIVS
jgi:general secretion pathway protein H